MQGIIDEAAVDCFVAECIARRLSPGSAGASATKFVRRPASGGGGGGGGGLDFASACKPPSSLSSYSAEGPPAPAYAPYHWPVSLSESFVLCKIEGEILNVKNSGEKCKNVLAPAYQAEECWKKYVDVFDEAFCVWQTHSGDPHTQSSWGRVDTISLHSTRSSISDQGWACNHSQRRVDDFDDLI